MPQHTIEEQEIHEQEQKEIKVPDFQEEFGRSERQIIAQVQEEYQLSWRYLYTKINEWYRRLKLYNNQRREGTKVGDPLVFTIFNTILASLYGDELAAEFMPEEDGDADQAEALNSLALFDHRKMEKDLLDYEWIWDTMFFGRGLMLMNEFSRKFKRPVPESIDPLSFLRDPRASSVNGIGIHGRGSARFFGREIRLSRNEIADDPNYFADAARLQPATHFSSTYLSSNVQQAKQSRDEAQGREVSLFQDVTKGDNQEVSLLEWFTVINGRKAIVTLGNQWKKIVRITALPQDCGWPVIDRTIYPMAHDWDGVSVLDLTEDKQRAKSVLINLGLEMAKADLYGMYVFDKNKIRNRHDLDFAQNKFIPVEGDPRSAVFPMPKSTAHQVSQMILNLLDDGSQRATATPEIQQGLPQQGAQTLGELQLAAGNAVTRYGLTSRIFGWSERRFWEQWYLLYKEHFIDKIDEKVIRIVGAFGPRFRALKREDFICAEDPDIRIESKIISEVKRERRRVAFQQYFALIAPDPSSNRRYGLKKLARLNGMDREEIDRLLPQTIDEREAEEENNAIEKGEFPKVTAIQDHMTHLEIHARAKDSEIRDKHMEFHKKVLMTKRAAPEMFPKEEAPEAAPAERVLQQVARRPVEEARLMARIPPTERAE